MKFTIMKQKRLDNKWTQEFVAKQINVSKQLIYDIETLRRKPSYEVLVKLENLFRLTHRELFTLVDDETHL